LQNESICRNEADEGNCYGMAVNESICKNPSLYSCQLILKTDNSCSNNLIDRICDTLSPPNQCK
jgi:hypothetical protein